MGNGRKNFFISLLLALCTLAVYIPSLGNHFTTYDDPQYVTTNRHVTRGLTVPNLLWAFTTSHASNWHPLTWISHMLDVQLYGLHPFGHHLTNVLLHIANVLLLFWTLLAMTRRPCPSAFVAALFAWHPLHVESVAWIAERKDLLSTFFFLLSLLSYTRYVRHQRRVFYFVSLFCFGLGLLSKPMLVTLPFVLLLLDFWPLQRIFRLKDITAWRKLLVEKIPFFLLSIVVSLITVNTQHQGGSVASLATLPLGSRIANAFVSYLRYVLKFIWPTDLSALYIHPGHWPLSIVAIALLFVIGITLLTVVHGARHPYSLVGWFWFLGTLVPVIGLVQVGVQSIADRYTYIPSIGLFILVIWGITELAQRWRYKAGLLTLLATGALAACLFLTLNQQRYWKNGEPLLRHALEVANREFPNPSPDPSNIAFTSGLASLHFNLALALEKSDKLDEALLHYNETSAIKPNYLNAHYNQGVILANQGKTAQSIDEFRAELKLNPTNSAALNNLGTELMQSGKADEALAAFLQALNLDPSNPTIHYNAGNAYISLHRWPEARAQYEAALKTNPNQPQLLDRLAWMLATSPDPNVRDVPEAVRLAQRACELTHNSNAALLSTLAAAYAEAGRFDEAVATQREVINILFKTHSKTGLEDATKRLQLYQSHHSLRESLPTAPKPQVHLPTSSAPTVS
jgi:protein O-mannosyl-transferase